ncbi:MAG: HNH endonuclease [Idiomarina sp.]|nr:HNH endonuclease [Idiomarina sp.]
MARRISKPCRTCRKLTRNASGYCDDHEEQGTTNWDRWQRKHGNRHKRGYGKDWVKLRRLILERDDNLCIHCLSLGRYTEATHVDHIVPKAKGGTDGEDNLQSLCKSCHEAKTARE